MAAQYEQIEGMKIHYEVHGSGPSVILLLHGAVGSTNDFRDQLHQGHGLSQDEYTMVALDLPGFGRSQLLAEMKANPTLDYFKLAATVAAKLMAKLKFKTYSVAGWSDGARVACLLAIEYKSRVNALILWAFLPMMDKESCWAIAKTRDIGTWNEQALESYSSVYGEQRFSDLWRKYVDFCVKSIELPQKFDISNMLSQIKCPTLILHGARDPIVNYNVHVEPLSGKIYDSTIVQIEGLAHNIHQADPAQFNGILGDFVLNAMSA